MARAFKARAREPKGFAPQVGWLVVALVAILAMKLAALLQLGDHPLLQPAAAGGLDSQYYLQLAQRVAGGDLLLAPGLYFVSPLYIYFLAALLSVGGGSLFLVKVVQVTLGTAACALIWLTAREWFSTRAAWVALAFSALTGAFTFYEILILQAALDPFLTALDLVLLTLALRRPGWGWAVASGAAMAVHSMNRPNMLFVAAGLVFALLARRDTRQTALMFAAGGALAFMPLSMRNLAAAGTFSPVPSHGGLNFYIGNNPDADGTYHAVPGITPNIAGQAEDARRLAERDERRRLTDGEVSAYFTGRGLRWWRDDPRSALQLLARKIAYTLNRAWLTLNYSYPFYRDESTVVRALVVGPVLLVPLGLLGLWSYPIAGRTTPDRFVIWATVVPLTILSIAIFFVASRYRIPLLVPLCVTGAGALDGVLLALSHRRVTAAVTAVACAFPLVTIAAWDFGLYDGQREEATQMALAMIDRRDWNEAQKYIERVEAQHPDPAVFHRRLGEAFVQANRPSEVIRHLEAARQYGARSVTSAYDLAVAYGQEGKPADAARVLMSIEPQEVTDPALRSTITDALTQAGVELTSAGRLGEAVAVLQRATRLSPVRAPAHLNLAVVYAQSGRRREAREEALRALALEPGYQRAKDFLAALDR